MPPFTTYYNSPIGLLKIAGTETYISEILFVEKGEHIAASYPVPDYVPPVLQQCVDELMEYFSGVRKQFTIPVAQTGTDFQQKVWNELLGIDFGKTISYMDMAKRLGDPKVIRAAASTNGKNKIAIIVPCHRVIGSNQTLVGYAGGLWSKRWLLDHENKIANGVRELF